MCSWGQEEAFSYVDDVPYQQAYLPAAVTVVPEVPERTDVSETPLTLEHGRRNDPHGRSQLLNTAGMSSSDMQQMLAGSPQCSSQQVVDGCCAPIGESHWQTQSTDGGSWSYNEHYVRYDFVNNADCVGNASANFSTMGVAVLNFTAPVASELLLDVSGRAQAHYEHCHVFLDGAHVASLTAGEGFGGEACIVSQCDMCKVSARANTIFVSAGGHSIEVLVNSSGHLYHMGAYFQIQVRSMEAHCNGCKCAGTCLNHDQAAVEVASRAGETLTGCSDSQVGELCQHEIHGMAMQLACPLVCDQCPPANCSNYDQVLPTVLSGGSPAPSDCSDAAVPALCQDPTDGLLVELACPEACDACDAQPMCEPDDPSRRRSGKSCTQMHTNGQSSCRIASQSRRRYYGGEAWDYCQTTCSAYVGCQVSPGATPSPTPPGPRAEPGGADPVSVQAECPPDDSTRRRSGKSCEQLTTDGVSSCAYAMTSRRRQYAAEAYEFCKTTCSSFLSDCQAADASTTSTTPPPADYMSGDSVSATDDPHLTNLAGEKFNVNQPGVYTLLRVPPDAKQPARFQLEANITGDGEKPCGLYIRAVVVSGEMLEGRTLHVRPMTRDRPGSNTAGSLMQNPFSLQVTSPGPSLGRWISVGESAAEDVTEATSDGVQVRAIRREAFGKRVEAQAFELRVHRATLVVSQASRQALNVQMSGVPSLAAGGQVGGLLGTSRHDKAIEKFTPECSASRQQALDSWMDSVEIGESATGATDA